MKQISYLLVLILSFFFFGCQEEITSKEADQKAKNEKAILGKWMFVSLIDNDNVATTKDAPCFYDNYIEFRIGSAGTISQGQCMEAPTFAQSEDFNWSFKSADILDLGGDEVKILQLTDSTLHFKKTDNPSNNNRFEYHWER
jgi:hypothetical protein